MTGNYTVLTGGVGGAKLVDGLYRTVAPDRLTAIVNTGDDFHHYGLAISPDIDTLLYTLAEKSNTELGWGRADESWNFMAALRELGGENWFNLGDGDMALHILRTAALGNGKSLTQVTDDFVRRWNLAVKVLPMTNDRISTWVDTAGGPLEFQRYFVEKRCEPVVESIRFEGSADAQPTPDALKAINDCEVIIIAPSNPWLSIDPILSMPSLRSALIKSEAPVILVSPLVRGTSVKGPTAKLMGELGLEINNRSIAAHYEGLLDGIIIHEGDDVPESIPVFEPNTLMVNIQDRCNLAKVTLNHAKSLIS